MVGERQDRQFSLEKSLQVSHDPWHVWHCVPVQNWPTLAGSRERKINRWSLMRSQVDDFPRGKPPTVTAGKMCLLLTWLTLLTAGFQAPAFLVQRETLVAGVTHGQVASDATHGTVQTFVTFLVRVIEVRAFRMARAFEFKVTRLASYTLVGIWSGARFAFGIARATSRIISKHTWFKNAFL